jgi:hypothetical protein
MVNAGGATWYLDSFGGYPVLGAAIYKGVGTEFLQELYPGLKYIGALTQPVVTTTGSGTSVKLSKPIVLESLIVNGSYFFSNKAPVMREIVTVQNTSSQPVKVPFLSFNEIGGRGTGVLGSSNGNAVFEPKLDRYVIYANSSVSVGVVPLTPPKPGLLPITIYRYGTGNVDKPLESEGGSGGFGDYFLATVPPGKKVSYMIIYVLNGPNVPAAINAAKDSKFNTLGGLLAAGYLADTNFADLLTFANWKF